MESGCSREVQEFRACPGAVDGAARPRDPHPGLLLGGLEGVIRCSAPSSAQSHSCTVTTLCAPWRTRSSRQLNVAAGMLGVSQRGLPSCQMGGN